MMMKKMMTIIAAVLLLMAASVHAQSDVAGQAVAEMKAVQEMLFSRDLSFELKYTYAGEHTPSAILDSLAGKIEMAGKNYRCVFDKTEFVHNEKYNVVLFGDDKLMYLTKSDATAGPADPFATMHKVLSDVGAERCDVSRKGRFKTVEIVFRDTTMCKGMKVTMDTVSKRLSSMTYVLKTSLLTEAGEMPDGYEPYALITAVFYNYGSLPRDKMKFDESVYFRREGSEYVVTDAYKDYTIFKGSSDL